MHLTHIVGARPNFMKAAPVIAAFEQYPTIRQTLVHTGQHYDERMSEIFFRQLGMPKPAVDLGVGSGSHASQTAEIMARFEKVVLQDRPDWLLVYGDVNSTLACSLVAAKLGIKIAHVEAGLRSGDRSMPEEINRLLTDQISDLCFTTSAEAEDNLKREGVPADRIVFVGNCMIDTLVRLLKQARQPEIPGLKGRFLLVTLHRPSNVDNAQRFETITRVLTQLSREIQVVFPVHPRTRQRLETQGLLNKTEGLLLTEPQGYLEFLGLQQHAAAILTDSGGIQEESTWLKVPCVTLRKSTERPITCAIGTNVLVGDDIHLAAMEIRKILAGQGKNGQIPPLWDGHAAERIAACMHKLTASPQPFSF